MVLYAVTIVPRWLSVWELYILQESMMLTPCGPRAVPTGGAGVAAPAGIWIFTTAAILFFAMFPSRRGPRPASSTSGFAAVALSFPGGALDPPPPRAASPPWPFRNG